MAKIEFETPVKSIRGKVSKSDTSYFSVKNGKAHFTKCYNQYDGGDTEQQRAARQRFAELCAQVKEQLSNETTRAEWQAKFESQHKFATLRGYVFHMLSL